MPLETKFDPGPEQATRILNWPAFAPVPRYSDAAPGGARPEISTFVAPTVRESSCTQVLVDHFQIDTVCVQFSEFLPL